MAGPVRQPIDVQKLENYIRDHVPEIATPLDVKQVRPDPSTNYAYTFLTICWVNCIVRLRSIKPYILTHISPNPSYGRTSEALRPTEETTRQASLQNSTPSRARTPHPPCTTRYRRPRSTGVRPLRRRGRYRDGVLHYGIPRRTRFYRSRDAGRYS